MHCQIDLEERLEVITVISEVNLSVCQFMLNTNNEKLSTWKNLLQSGSMESKLSVLLLLLF